MRGRQIGTLVVWMLIIYMFAFVNKVWKDEEMRCGTLLDCQPQQYNFDPLSLYEEESDPSLEESEDDHDVSDLTIDHRVPTKVLFLGYRRGGSSISSEIFDTDPRAVFWYEPLDSFYFTNTGYHGRKDQRVLMFDNETNFRPIEPWEHAKMAKFFRDLYDCNLSKMPSEFLAHRFMKHTSALEGYSTCYQRMSTAGIEDDLDNCRNILKNVCGRSVEFGIQNNCRVIMSVVQSLSQRNMKDSELKEHLRRKLSNGRMPRASIDAVLEDVVAYSKCISKVDPIIEKCLPNAILGCKEKKLRTAKIVRTTMSVVKSIITEIPDLKIIIFVRDPRAMAYSRSGLDKLPLNILKSCERACNKLLLDFKFINEIKKQYPGSVKILKYEDFVQDPYYWAKVMYNHVGYNTPDTLDEFIQSHMFAEEDDGKKWGNIRTNASEIASKWRSLVDPKLMSEMQHICGGLIQALGYPLY